MLGIAYLIPIIYPDIYQRIFFFQLSVILSCLITSDHVVHTSVDIAFFIFIVSVF